MIETKEQFLETAVGLILDQGKLCDTGCEYRGCEDTSCFIGLTIVDEAYHDDIEGDTVEAESVIDALIISGISEHFIVEEMEFLVDFQGLHDKAVDDDDKSFDDVITGLKLFCIEHIGKIPEKLQ